MLSNCRLGTPVLELQHVTEHVTEQSVLGETWNLDMMYSKWEPMY